MRATLAALLASRRCLVKDRDTYRELLAANIEDLIELDRRYDFLRVSFEKQSQSVAELLEMGCAMQQQRDRAVRHAEWADRLTDAAWKVAAEYASMTAAGLQ